MEVKNLELKKNLSKDTVFNTINKMFISLEDDDVRRTNKSLLLVCFYIICYDNIYWLAYIIYIILYYILYYIIL